LVVAVPAEEDNRCYIGPWEEGPSVRFDSSLSYRRIGKAWAGEPERIS